MTIAAHPKEHEPCPECGSELFSQNRRVEQIGMTYTCESCGVELYVYDNSEHGMGKSLTWQQAAPAIQSLGHERQCQDCGYEWHYGGSADRPTCPKCKGKRTQKMN